MVSTRRKEQQIKKLLSQLGESDADFMVGQSNHEARTDSRATAVDKNTYLNNTEGSNQVSCSQLDIHTLDENIVIKVRSEVGSVMTTVKTRVQDAMMTAIENLAFPEVELAMKSGNASYGHGLGSVVMDPDQRVFPGNVEGLQMTASSRINSQTDLNGIDENRGSITVEGRDLMVDEEKSANTHSSQFCFEKFTMCPIAANHFQ